MLCLLSAGFVSGGGVGTGVDLKNEVKPKEEDDSGGGEVAVELLVLWEAALLRGARRLGAWRTGHLSLS